MARSSSMRASDTPSGAPADLANSLPSLRCRHRYSLIERTAERDVLPMCEDMNVGCVPWGVLRALQLYGYPPYSYA